MLCGKARRRGVIKVEKHWGHPPYGTVKETNTSESSDIPRNTGR